MKSLILIPLLALSCRGSKPAQAQEEIMIDKTGDSILQMVATVPGKVTLLPGVYHLAQTLRLPGLQDEILDFSQNILNYEGDPSQPAVIFDSMMNCRVDIGKIVYSGESAALQIRPEHGVPIDGAVAFTENYIHVNTLAVGEPMGGLDHAGTGIYFDSRIGPIVNNSIEVGSIVNFRYGLLAQDTGHGTRWNDIRILNLHSNIPGSYLAKLGSDFLSNWFRATASYDGGVSGPWVVMGGGNRPDLFRR